MDAAEKKLLKWFSALDGEGRGQVLAFTEFLYERRPNPQPLVAEPLKIPRPTEESVVKAIRRLAETYPMLDNAKMLHETSMFMSQHVMQGRPAVEVVDDLELLFSRHFDQWREEQRAETSAEPPVDGAGG